MCQHCSELRNDVNTFNKVQLYDDVVISYTLFWWIIIIFLILLLDHNCATLDITKCDFLKV